MFLKLCKTVTEGYDSFFANFFLILLQLSVTNLIIVPKVFAVVKVPGRCVANHLSIIRLHQHGLIPELLGHLL